MSPCKIFHQNVQHLSSKLEILKIHIAEIKPEILTLSEHKMSGDEISLLHIPGYKLSSFYTRSSYLGGGVMILTQNQVKCKTIVMPAIQELLVDKEFECCLSEISISNFVFILGCIYRSPMQCLIESFLLKFDTLCSILCKKYSNVILTGDYNINILKRDNVYHKFVNILKSHDLSYKVDFPTRVYLGSESAIDNIVTNIKDRECKVTGLITHISDHDAQIFEIFGLNSNVRKLCKKYHRKFTQNTIEQFYKNLQKESWLEVYQSPVDLKYKTFSDIFFYNFNVCFPKALTTMRQDNFSKWITDEVRFRKNEIHNLETHYRVNKNEDLKITIKNLKRDLKMCIERDKKQFFEDKILKAENNSKVTWNLIRTQVKKSSGTMSNIQVDYNGKSVSNPIDVATIFNDFFVSVVDKSILTEIHENNGNYQYGYNTAKTNFKFVPITESDIVKIITSFKNKPSSGHDDLSINIVKQVMPTIIKPLVHLINSSFISSYFPDELKVAKVIPIFKKGETKDPSCYRPVSLLPIFSKIYEKVVYNQLVSYLEKNKLFDAEQHGFQSGKSTITAGINFINSIVDPIDRGEKVVGVFLDLSRAFDSVCHKKLIESLSSLGILAKEINWFKSYLKNRQQYVEIENVSSNNTDKYIYLNKINSKRLTVQHGVPQGSILGPLLFLCYLRGLPNVIPGSSTICLYADDSNLTVSGKSKEIIEESAFICLSVIKDFFDEKSLLINTNKTNFISFCTKQSRNNFQPTLLLGDSILEQVECTKFLGLQIDANLSYDKHIDQVTSKMSSGLYALRQLSKICSLETLKKVYFALVHSHLAYGISIYGCTTKNNLNRILVQQKKAIRIMCNLKRKDSVKHMFRELNILTVIGVFILETVTYTKQFSNPSQVLVRHNYNTRENRHVERHNLGFY